MANYFSDALHISQKYHNKIKKICSPLTELLGVDYVTYHTVDKEGNYTLAINRPDYGEYYIAHQAYTFDPYLRHPRFLQSGITLWDQFPDPKFSNFLQQAKGDFKLDHGFAIINKSPDKVAIIGFAAPIIDRNLLSLYLNELPLFRHFFQYFLEESHKMLQEMANDPITLLPLLGQRFFESQGQQDSLSPEQRHQFLRQVTLKDRPSDMELTNREKQCLQALLKGYTAKQTALELKLSQRTIEHFLENAKAKLECRHKSELFKKADRLKILGLLEDDR